MSHLWATELEKNPCGLPQRNVRINKLMFIKNLNYLSEMLLFKFKVELFDFIS